MVTADAALEFIRKHAGGDKPFLAVVWFGSPHLPHKPAEEDRALYADQEEEMANYYGEITGMDRAFGKLRSELKTLGIRDNTILFFCSDNGGVKGVSVTGGRANKGQVYEGGLRVPAILEWPERIPKPRTTNMPCNTSDMLPTLLDIVGVRPDKDRPLDGVSLVPLIDGKAKSRPKPIGFWDIKESGIRTPSDEWMTELLALQKGGREETDPARLCLDAGKIQKQYPEDSFPGHSAWLDWPWKLHRIQDKAGETKLELYNLADDPDEKTDLSATEADRVKSMRPGLEKWLTSVVRSLNGKDYR